MPFLPISEAKAAEFRDRLSKTMFRDPEFFVQVYNNGMINPKHDDVVGIVTEMSEIFRDIRKKGNQIHFIDVDEVLLEETLRALDVWGTFVKMKSALNHLVENDELGSDDDVFFVESDPGYAHVVDESGEIVKLATEKLFRNHEDIHTIRKVCGVGHRREDGSVRIKNNEIQAVDTSFIGQIHGLIPRR